MIVQWCCKGMPGLSQNHVRHILLDGEGILCAHWHNAKSTPAKRAPLPVAEALDRLSEWDLDQHLHNFAAVRSTTAFISLSAGCVSRDTALRKNIRHPARLTALDFATKAGSTQGWIFTCYVFVGINPAPEIPAVAEEVRELNHARPYSPYYTEGEVAAKLHVPSRQILSAEEWTPDGSGGFGVRAFLNPRFVSPRPLVNERASL